MSRISAFHGLVIYMYYDEGAHLRAHFHVRGSGERASVALDGTVLSGALSARTAKLVAGWALQHAAELEANWENGRDHKPFEKVEPLS